MPRAQVYISQNNYKRIQSIVDEKKEDGADRTEANISSVAAMLLDIGLRVYEFQKKKEQNDEIEKNEICADSSDMRVFDRIMLENILRASYASTIILQMVGEMEELKGTESFNYDKVKSQIRSRIHEQMDKIFGEE